MQFLQAASDEENDATHSQRQRHNSSTDYRARSVKQTRTAADVMLKHRAL